MARHDSAAYIRLIGPGVFTLMAPYGVSTGSREEEVHEEIAECELPRHDIDSLAIEHPAPTTVIVAYRLRREAKCPSDDKVPPTLDVMTVWVQRPSGWQLVARSVAFPRD